MYLCERCGMSREQLPDYIEPHGEITNDRRCPECGHKMVEAVECFRCGELVAEADTERDETRHRVCFRCIDEEEQHREHLRRKRELRYGDLVRIDERVYQPA